MFHTPEKVKPAPQYDSLNGCVGIIISNDDKFEVQARSVHDCGRMFGEWFYSHYIYGSNYRLREWQGAILNVQLSRLDEQTKRRHQNSRLLDRLLSEHRKSWTNAARAYGLTFPTLYFRLSIPSP